MEKKSIGSFLAVLRRAGGMTQAEVAQKLFISNKTVSKWERDESSPDLAMIPVLAELFGVTCDEILRGERGNNEQGDDGKAGLKTEKQVKRILTHTVNQFKSMSYIAASLALLGLVCQFAVTYSFFKSLVAFALAFIFILASVVLETIQLSRANNALLDGPLLEDGSSLFTTQVTLIHRIAFAVFTLNTWICVLIWPVMAAEGLDNYVNVVLSIDTYRAMLPGLAVICLTSAAFGIYFTRNWLGLKIDKKDIAIHLRYRTPMIRRIAQIQDAFLLVFVILCLMPSLIFQLIGGYRVSVVILLLAAIVAGLTVVVVAFINTIHRSKDKLERILILLTSARNVLYGIISVIVINFISISIANSYPLSLSQFLFSDITAALFQALLITIAYSAIKYLLVKKYSIRPTDAAQQSNG